MPGASPAAVELSADCEACGLEAGVVEVYDVLVAACRFGLPARTYCKLCASTHEGTFDRDLAKSLSEIPANLCPACLHELGQRAVDERGCSACGARAAVVETHSPLALGSLADLEAALDAWAERERFPSRQALVNATFAEGSIPALFERITKKEPLEVLADPFANMGVKTTGGGRGKKNESPKAPSSPSDPSAPPPAAPVTLTREDGSERVRVAHATAANAMAKTAPEGGLRDAVRLVEARIAAGTPPAPHEPPPRSAPPRAIVYPIVSVIAADGEIHPEERALIDRFLKSEGLPPLTEEEYAVHHPSEVARFVPKERREDVVKLMCETAAVDGMPDESERRVIRAYATAWDVDDEKLEFWLWGYESINTSLTRQLWLKIRRFVLSARWSDEMTDRRAGRVDAD